MGLDQDLYEYKDGYCLLDNHGKPLTDVSALLGTHVAEWRNCYLLADVFLDWDQDFRKLSHNSKAVSGEFLCSLKERCERALLHETDKEWWNDPDCNHLIQLEGTTYLIWRDDHPEGVESQKYHDFFFQQLHMIINGLKDVRKDINYIYREC